MAQAIAALVREPGGRAQLTPVSLRTPAAGEVRVRIEASGICATDLFAIDGGVGPVFPAVFGHEGAGVVEEVGADVTSLSPGDRVILSFDACRACAACEAGAPSSCESFAALNYRGRIDGVTGPDEEPVRAGWLAQSSWASEVVVPARIAVPVGADVPWGVAAALGCGVLTGAGTVFNVLGAGPGDALLVMGAGTTGLAAIMAA